MYRTPPEENAQEFDLEAALVENPAHEAQQPAPPEKAEEVTIGMKKSTDARKKLRPAKTCQSVLQEGEGLWRRTDTKRMVPSLSAPT